MNGGAVPPATRAVREPIEASDRAQDCPRPHRPARRPACRRSDAQRRRRRLGRAGRRGDAGEDKMNARSFAGAKAPELSPTEVGDRCREEKGGRRKRRKVSDDKGERCVLHPTVREIPSYPECPSPVDVALRPFIVAVANAIIKDILRERRDGPASGHLRKA